MTGYSSAVGTHTMTATAFDKAGNAATATRSYTVQAWALSGFYNPVDMGASGINSVKGGSTVPLKFEVFAGFTELTDVGFIGATIQTQTSDCSAAYEDPIEAEATGHTELRYDAASGHFIFNWKTPKTPGKCMKLTLTTADGSTLSAKFKFK